MKSPEQFQIVTDAILTHKRSFLNNFNGTISAGQAIGIISVAISSPKQQV